MSTTKTTFGKSTLMIGLLAASGLLTTSAFAMPNGGPDKPGFEGKPVVQQMQNQREDFRGKQMAELKGKLKLQPQQEGAWQAFTKDTFTVKLGFGKDERHAKQEAFRKMDTPQRMDKLMARSEMRHHNTLHRAIAVKKFYAQLNPGQQKVFDDEMRFSRNKQHGHHDGHHQHHHGKHADRC